METLFFDDAFADLITNEGDNLNAFLFQELADGLGIVEQEWLKGQAALRQDFVDFAFDDLVQHLLWFASKFRIVMDFGESDVLFSFSISSRNVLQSDVERGIRGDVHGDGLGNFGIILGKKDDDADFASHVRIGSVGLASFFVEDGVTTEVELFATGDGAVIQVTGDKLFGFFDGGRFVLQDFFRDGVGESDEFVGSGDEVRFAIGFDDDGSAALVADFDGGQAFAGGSTGAFGLLGDAFFTEKVDRFFDVPTAFFESVLAIHHASTGSFADGLD